MRNTNGRRWPIWMHSYLVRYKREVLLALALGLAASSCAALLMFTSGYLISATALASTTLFSVMVPVACVQLFGLGRPLSRYAERLASHDWVLKVTSDLRIALFNGIGRATGDPARERAAGEYLGLLSDDVAHLQNLYLRVVFPSVVAYALVVLASLLFGFFSVPFALVMLFSLAGVTVLLPYVSLLSTRALIERSKHLRAAETTILADDIRGSVDWVLSGRCDEARRSHAGADTLLRSVDAAARRRERVCSLIAALALIGLLCATVAWAGTTMERIGASANWIAAFALGFFPIIESLAMLPASWSEATTHRGSTRRLDDYIGEANEAPPENPRVNTGAYALSLRKVSYTYPTGKRPALEGVSIDVPPGQSVAVLGRSGSGKSTFARLACGVISPDVGTVCAMGAVGYLGQHPYLFNRTLRENLTIGAPEASDSELERVLVAVGLGDKLDSLPMGLDTIIGETGVGFSGGEAHRIALSRVLLADTPIVLVDEPFSALDPETEVELLDTLLTTCEAKALIVITHHLAQIERFDRVIFIEDAHVDLDGTPSELLKTSERFRTLVAFDRN